LVCYLEVQSLENGAECTTTNFFKNLIALSKWIKFIKTSSTSSLCLLSNLYLSLYILSYLLLTIFLSCIKQGHQIVIGLIIIFDTLSITLILILSVFLLYTIATFRHLSQLCAIVEVRVIVINFLVLTHANYWHWSLESKLRFRL